MGLAFGNGSALHAQLVLDGPFISERWLVNARANMLDDQFDSDLVEGHVDVRTFLMDNCTSIQDYALDDPQDWTARCYFRVDVAENPALKVLYAGDRAVPFDSVMNAAARGVREGPSVFADLRFSAPKRTVVAAGIRSLVLKVDLAYNDSIGVLQPHVIGLQLEGDDGRGSAFYYPELHYYLKDFNVRTAHGMIRCSDYFEQWRFIAHALPDLQQETGHRWHDAMPYERQSEFDALRELFLIEHEIANRNVIRRGKHAVKLTSYLPQPRGASVQFTDKGELERITVKKGGTVLLTANYKDGVPHGPFREFHTDGGLAQQGQFEHGLREGQWASWFPNGNIHSRRLYTKGRLDGKQRAYYDGGTLMLEYDMVNGEYEGEHHAFFPDGHLRSSGNMHEGFVTGEWDYAQRISDDLRTYMDAHPQLFDFPPSAWQDDYLSYRVTYVPDPAGKNCPLQRCYRTVRSVPE